MEWFDVVMVWAPCRLQGCQEAQILLRVWPSLTIAVRRAATRGGKVGKSSSKEPEAARAFVTYLMSQAAIAVVKAKGMSPG